MRMNMPMAMAMAMDGNDLADSGLPATVKWIVGLTAIILAVLACAIALSTGLEKRRPDVALAINPFNDAASTRIARGMFASLAGTGTPQGIADGAAAARTFALDAYRVKPLSPDALTLLGWSQSDGNARDAILLGTATLNKRSSMLSGALLTVHSQNEDVDAALDTLNNFLAVHPDKIDALEPFLLQTLSDPEGPRVFRRIFRDEPLWMDEFIARAGRDGGSLDNLFAITEIMETGKALSRRTNIILMRRYLEAGRITQAFSTYQGLISDRPLQKPACRVGSGERLDWCTEFAPFDWRLGEGARVSSILLSANPMIEFRPTKTGRELIAQRIVKGGENPMRIMLDYDAEDPAFGDNTELSVLCAEDRDQVFSGTLTSISRSGGATMERPCDYAIISVVSLRSARAAPNRGVIKGITLD